MKCLLKIFSFFAMFMLLMTVVYAKPLYPFNSQAQEKEFNYLLQTLRCLVCQNENLAASNAQLAADLRQQIYVQVKAGESVENIKNYMVARYGDFVLYKPPVVERTYVLWFLPFVALFLGFVILFFSVRKHRLAKKVGT